MKRLAFLFSAHLKYARYLFRHIWFVRKACWRNGLYWQGIIHDLSKFRLSEWVPYAMFFYGPEAKRAAETVNAAFDFAWLLHQKRNKHHWQFWVLPLDDGGTKCLSMPLRYRLEMLCDWWGASMAQGYGGECVKWYSANSRNMQLHPETREWVESHLEDFEIYMNDPITEGRKPWRLSLSRARKSW